MKAAAAKRSEMRALADLNSLSLINFIISDANVSGSPAQTAAREAGELLVTGAAISARCWSSDGSSAERGTAFFFLRSAARKPLKSKTQSP